MELKLKTMWCDGTTHLVVLLPESMQRRFDGQLCGIEFCERYVSSGSASDSGVSDLTAGKLTAKLSDRIADVRGRQWPTRTGHPVVKPDRLAPVIREHRRGHAT